MIPAYNRKLETAATLTGPQRYRAYGALDVDLARNAAPLVAIANYAPPRLLLGTNRLPHLPARVRIRPRDALSEAPLAELRIAAGVSLISG